jgi:hypothetical protein
MSAWSARGHSPSSELLSGVAVLDQLRTICSYRLGHLQWSTSIDEVVKTFRSREQSYRNDSCRRAVLIPTQLWRTVLRKLVLWRSLDEDMGFWLVGFSTDSLMFEPEPEPEPDRARFDPLHSFVILRFDHRQLDHGVWARGIQAQVRSVLFSMAIQIDRAWAWFGP